ncbi:MAG TPA: hypothetical protein VIF63_06610, partial [Candidatus Limnocylindrales bacterium]
EVLANAGAAQLIDDDAFDADALLAAVAVLENPTRHATMAAASRSLGRPGAAGAVATLLLALAERRALPDAAAVARIAAGAL